MTTPITCPAPLVTTTLKFASALAAAALLFCPAVGHAQSEAITYFPVLATGSGLAGPLVPAPDGTFYGANSAGGVNGGGTIVQFAPDGTITLLYTFSALEENSTINKDGYGPCGGIVLGKDGNLYGTTTAGGKNAQGTVFEVTPDGKFKKLADLTTATGHASPGALVMDHQGNLYGTGLYNDAQEGTVFKVTPSGVISILHAFTQPDFNGNNYDGAMPGSGLVIDSGDVMYGTTTVAGPNGGGTIFSITTSGAFSTEYGFGVTTPPAGNANGTSPSGPLAITKDGTVYGVAGGGPNVFGIVYKFSGGDAVPIALFSDIPNGSNGDNADGSYPTGLTVGPDGNLYGSTRGGGANGSGTVFKVTPGGALTTLYACQANETVPLPPVLGADKAIYGGDGLNDTFASSRIFRLESTRVPVITSAATITGQAGNSFSYKITAIHAPTSFGAGDLPPGVSVDAKTGELNGVFPISGTSTIRLSAKNAFGTGYAKLTVIASEDPPGGPTLDLPAAPLVTYVGQNFTYQIDNGRAAPLTKYDIYGAPPKWQVDFQTGTIKGYAAAAKEYLIEVVAKNQQGTSTGNFEVDILPAPILPVVSLAASDPQANAATGDPGNFTLSLDTASAVPLEVNYDVKGTAVPGVDYEILEGTVKIKAGKTSKNIEVTPIAAPGGTATKVVKLTLEPGVGYTIGTPDPVKVKILDSK